MEHAPLDRYKEEEEEEYVPVKSALLPFQFIITHLKRSGKTHFPSDAAENKCTTRANRALYLAVFNLFPISFYNKHQIFSLFSLYILVIFCSLATIITCMC